MRIGTRSNGEKRNVLQKKSKNNNNNTLKVNENKKKRKLFQHNNKKFYFTNVTMNLQLFVFLSFVSLLFFVISSALMVLFFLSCSWFCQCTFGRLLSRFKATKRKCVRSNV